MMQLQNPLWLSSVKDQLAWRHRWLPALSVALFYLVLAASWLRWGRAWLANFSLSQIWVEVAPILLIGLALLLLCLAYFSSQHKRLMTLLTSQGHFKEMAERIHEVFAVFDLRQRRFSYVAPGYAELWGRPVEELLSSPLSWLRWVAAGERRLLLDSLRHLSPEGEQRVEFALHGQGDDALRWVRVQLYPVCTAQGRERHLARIVVLAEDITRSKQQEQALLHQIRHDPLTGLPNRRYMHERLVDLLIESPELPFALLFVDLDRFKNINDTAGHVVGDDLLRQVAMRMRYTLPTSCFIARMGGDEFAVIVPTGQQADEVAHQLLESMRRPFMLSRELVHITLSIGLVHYPKDAMDADELLAHADMAMYAAKRQGRDTLQTYTPVLSEQTLAKVRMAKELRLAVQQAALTVFYQPVYSLHTGRLSGAEALLRWRNQAGEWISPADFIPLLEESGQIVPVTDWLLGRALSHLRTWRQSWPDFRLALNISAISMQDRHLVNSVERSLLRHRLEGQALELEVTETAFIRDPDKASLVCDELKRLAVDLAVDDFGTGYSSLIYLKRFAPDRVKIDRSFVAGMVNSPGDQALVRAIIELVHSLNMKVVAEGVETQEQLQLLQQMGCDYVQGYYCGRPQPEEAWVNVVPNLFTHRPLVDTWQGLGQLTTEASL
ncbi:putative bifunctional diguanylate cyclase/phosphodiesterase [Pseudaeromonas paramecii]|uniref:EAL domain-containing protein n=1 Tax=Pseudaeromonas paramecii TaxID=2138166 RepID=A0ABP8Q2Q0_9GAMM